MSLPPPPRTAADSLLRSDIDLRAEGKAIGFVRQPHSVHRSAYGWIPTPIARIARVPSQHVSSDDRSSLKNLDRDLKAVVFGQEPAINALAKSTAATTAAMPSPPWFLRDFAPAVVQSIVMAQPTLSETVFLTRTEFAIEGSPARCSLVFLPTPDQADLSGAAG